MPKRNKPTSVQKCERETGAVDEQDGAKWRSSEERHTASDCRKEEGGNEGGLVVGDSTNDSPATCRAGRDWTFAPRHLPLPKAIIADICPLIRFRV